MGAIVGYEDRLSVLDRAGRLVCKLWDASRAAVSATNCVWSQKIAGIEKPLEANVSKGFDVPPVGFEPTTHDLKGRCSNR